MDTQVKKVDLHGNQPLNVLILVPKAIVHNDNVHKAMFLTMVKIGLLAAFH